MIDFKRFSNEFGEVVEQQIDEESMAPTNVTGENVATDKPVVRTRKFANNCVFDVDGKKYLNCIKGKHRYHRYQKYVGDDDVGEAIRQYGRSNPGRGIIVRDEETGAMSFLKKPKG